MHGRLWSAFEMRDLFNLNFRQLRFTASACNYITS